MASPKQARPVALSVGIGVAALFTAAATALPAAADNGNGNGSGNGNHGNSANAPGHNKSDQSANNQTPSDESGHNPPGNNGTVFIHDEQNDQHPHNVPHVSCTFYVDFFNFDNGQQVTVSFAGQAPTGKDTALGGETTTTLQADDASGAGNDWDGELTFTADQLGVKNLGDPAHQGYHVKMTVVTNEPGDHKYKVFWLEPCATAQTTSTQPTDVAGESTTTAQSTSAASNTTQTSSATSSQPATTTSGQSTGGALAPLSASQSKSGLPTEVLGTKFTRGGATPAAAATSSSLPFTGAEIGAMALAAAAALGSGVLLIVAGRRRRRLSSN